jgi:hypothetical protein
MVKTYEFFIPGNVPSLKNSKIKTKRGIFPSKTVVKYLQEMGIKSYSVRDKQVEDYKTRPNKFREHLRKFPMLHEKHYPIEVGFHFIRRTAADFDFNNATQIIQDLLVAHDYITDDSMRFFIPYVLKVDGRNYSLDKENPGVILKLRV